MLLYSRVIHVARVWHLLDENTKGLGLRCVRPYHGVVHHILQVGEASLYIPHVVKGVVSGPGRP